MKKVLLMFLLMAGIFCMPAESFAQKKSSYKPKTVKVKGYTTKKGKYVRPHYRSKPSKRKRTFIIHPMLAPKEWAA